MFLPYLWLFDELWAEILRVMRAHGYCQTANDHQGTLRLRRDMAVFRDFREYFEGPFESGSHWCKFGLQFIF